MENEGIPIGMTASETVRGLLSYADALRHSVFAMARRVARTAPIELKMLMGHHLFDDTTLITRIELRVERLAMESVVERSDAFASAKELLDSEVTAEEWFAAYELLKRQLAHSMAVHRSLTHCVWDYPTVQLLEEAEIVIERQLRSLSEAREAVDAAFGVNRPRLWSEAIAPVDERQRLPARDPRFVVVAVIPHRPASGSLRDQLIFDMHYNLMQLEIPTIEACAENIALFPDMPWEFVSDMARQAADEARHAAACRDRLLDLGGHLGQHPADVTLWRLVDGLSLPMRLSTHQRIGEWIGVDGALWASEALATEDPVTSRLYEFIACDEMTHVAIGNRWIRYSTPDVEVHRLHEMALERRKSAGALVDGPHPFPFHRWACEPCGFTDEETRRLAEDIRARASRSAPV